MLMLGIEVVAFLAGFVLHSYHFMCVSMCSGIALFVLVCSWLQEAGATILIGATVGGLIRYVTNVSRLQSVTRFNSEFFFLFLLPPIIFESGYNMKRVRETTTP